MQNKLCIKNTVCFHIGIYMFLILGLFVNLTLDAYAQKLTPQGQQESELQKLMMPAIEAYRKGNYEEALELIDKATSLAPKNKSLIKLRGEIILKISDQYQQKGDWGKARDFAFKALGSSMGEIDLLAQEKLKLMEKRPEQGLRGFISSGFEYNTNVRSSVAPGNTAPTDTPGYGNRSNLLVGYQKHVGRDFYWDVWGQASSMLWSGKADKFDDWSFSSGLSVGAARERWDVSFSYKFSSSYFADQLFLIRQGGESNLKYWVIPNKWQAWFTTGVFVDDFKASLAKADALQTNVSFNNYIPILFKPFNRYGYLFGGYTFINNHVPTDLDNIGASTNFGYSGHRTNLMLYIPTPFQTVGIQMGGQVETRHYDRLDSLTRRDTVYLAFAEVVKDWKLPDMKITRQLGGDILQTKIAYNYFEIQSNNDLFDMKQHVGRITLSYNF